MESWVSGVSAETGFPFLFGSGMCEDKILLIWYLYVNGIETHFSVWLRLSSSTMQSNQTTEAVDVLPFSFCFLAECTPIV